MEKHPVPVKTKPSGEKTVSVQNLVGAAIQLPESKYRNAEWDIQYALKAQERCRNCSGKKCTQPTPGYMPLVVYYAGTVREASVPVPMGKSSAGKNGTGSCWNRPDCRKCSFPAPFRNTRWNRGTARPWRPSGSWPGKNGPAGASSSTDLPGWARPCWQCFLPRSSLPRAKPSGSPPWPDC